MSEETLWTVHEAAEFLGTNVNTVYSWVRQEKIPNFKLGGLVRFRRSDLEAWLDQSRRGEAVSA